MSQRIAFFTNLLFKKRMDECWKEGEMRKKNQWNLFNLKVSKSFIITSKRVTIQIFVVWSYPKIQKSFYIWMSIVYLTYFWHFFYQVFWKQNNCLSELNSPGFRVVVNFDRLLCITFLMGSWHGGSLKLLPLSDLVLFFGSIAHTNP